MRDGLSFSFLDQLFLVGKENAVKIFIVTIYLFIFTESFDVPDAYSVQPYIGPFLLIVYLGLTHKDSLLSEFEEALHPFLTFITIGHVILFLFLMNYSDLTFIQPYLQGISPALAYMAYRDLIKNNAYQTDAWQGISIAIKSLTKSNDKQENQAIALIPVNRSSKYPLGTYKCINPVNLASISLQNKNQQVVKDLTIKTAPIYLASNERKNHSERVFQLFSPNSLAPLWPISDEVNIPNVDRIKGTSEAHMFLAQLFRPSRNLEYTKQFYSIENYLKHGKVTELQFDSDDSKSRDKTVHFKITWEFHQLESTVSEIANSMLEIGMNRDPATNVLKRTYTSRLRELYKISPPQFWACCNLVNLISAPKPRENRDSYEEMKIAMLSSYARACATFIGTDTTQSTENIGHIESQEVSKYIREQRKILQTCLDGPIDQFIYYHDAIVDLGSGSDDSYYEILSKIVHGMMDELKRTSHRRFLIKETNYQSENLVQMRKGIVIGTTVALQMLERLVRKK